MFQFGGLVDRRVQSPCQKPGRQVPQAGAWRVPTECDVLVGHIDRLACPEPLPFRFMSVSCRVVGSRRPEHALKHPVHVLYLGIGYGRLISPPCHPLTRFGADLGRCLGIPMSHGSRTQSRRNLRSGTAEPSRSAPTNARSNWIGSAAIGLRSP